MDQWTFSTSLLCSNQSLFFYPSVINNSTMFVCLQVIFHIGFSFSEEISIRSSSSSQLLQNQPTWKIQLWESDIMHMRVVTKIINFHILPLAFLRTVKLTNHSTIWLYNYISILFYRNGNVCGLTQNLSSVTEILSTMPYTVPV